MDSTLDLLGALTSLRQISADINHLGSGENNRVGDTLRLIIASTAEAVPGCSAEIYAYNDLTGGFDSASRVSLDVFLLPDLGNSRLMQTMGRRAVELQRQVLASEEQDLAQAADQLQVTEIVCFPLIVSTEVFGALFAGVSGRPAFTESELIVMENFAGLAAMALSLAGQATHAQQEQARKEKELRRLRRAGMLISSRSSLKGTLEVILRMALEVMDAKYGIFRLVDKSGKNLVTQAIAGERLGRPATETLPIDEKSIMGMVALRREPLMIPDLLQEPWKGIYYPFDHDLEMRSELAVPLIGASGRLEGVLNLESPQFNAFDRQDRYILQILATQAVIAIQEIRLLDALQEVSSLLLTQPLQSLLQGLVERACDLLNMPLSLIWLLEKDHLVLRASSDPAVCDRQIDLQESLTGQAILTGQPVTCAQACEERLARQELAANSNSTGSVLVMPILASEDRIPIGAFSVYSSQTDFTDIDQSEWNKKVLSILGHYAALAVQNSAHLEALRNMQEQRAVAEAFAAVGDIAANLLHSLNNKMGTIPVRVEGIQDKSRASLDADSYLAKNLVEIERSASEAMEIVRESLFHLHPIHLHSVRVIDCVREAIDSLDIPPGIQVQTQGLEDLPPVRAGQKRLTFVFTNLLENAIDALVTKGSIQVIGARQDGLVEVSIRDSGPGIAPEHHERIFEFDYSSRSVERPGKLGFGLWWVKTVMNRFGGKVTVISDGHQGTTFRLSFPLEPGER